LIRPLLEPIQVISGRINPAPTGNFDPASGPEEVAMEGLIIFFIALAIFERAAWRWGVDSRDGIDSPEWQRRQLWHGFH
jgi:hypothetical protein